MEWNAYTWYQRQRFYIKSFQIFSLLVISFFCYSWFVDTQLFSTTIGTVFISFPPSIRNRGMPFNFYSNELKTVDSFSSICKCTPFFWYPFIHTLHTYTYKKTFYVTFCRESGLPESKDVGTFHFSSFDNDDNQVFITRCLVQRFGAGSVHHTAFGSVRGRGPNSKRWFSHMRIIFSPPLLPRKDVC